MKQDVELKNTFKAGFKFTLGCIAARALQDFVVLCIIITFMLLFTKLGR